ncbi:hypothetical protein MUN78_16540 [Leucobacter allii]|uniref:Uncharacterized protein n=1 Tax=Leucobacter allii TaxID=2932247 RepID=A0ABY4FLU5_9MICO|nr:hypothetical protein [Leucobacter allii]UOQ57239.1 hypothetical protein MUN78_16540 [Leucobacter allii]
MELKEATIRMRDAIAPRLDDYSLELLDIEIEEGDWETAHGMAVQAAKFHHIDVPDEILEAA